MLSKEGPFSVFSCSVNELLECLVVLIFLKVLEPTPVVLERWVEENLFHEPSLIGKSI